MDKSEEFLAKQLRSRNVNVEDSESGPIYLFINSNGKKLQEHVSRTPGLLHFFFHYGEVCRVSNLFTSILDRMKMMGASIMEFPLLLREQFVFEHLQTACGTNISRGLMVSGFLQSLTNRFNAVLPTVKQIWTELKTHEHIQAEFPTSMNASVGFIDLLMFTFGHYVGAQGKSKANSLVQLIGLLRSDFIFLISKCVNSYIEKHVRNDPRFCNFSEFACYSKKIKK